MRIGPDGHRDEEAYHDRDHRRALQCVFPADCDEQTVITSDFADVSMQSCLGARQLAIG